MTRHIVWWSAGAASTIAAKLHLDALGNAICRPGGKPVWLDELDPNRGRIQDEPMMECGVLCAADVEP